MKYEEKLELVREMYGENSKKYPIASKRDDELKADYFYLNTHDLRGPGSFVVGDDGTFLFCSSQYSYSFCIEKFKEGDRSN